MGGSGWLDGRQSYAQQWWQAELLLPSLRAATSGALIESLTWRQGLGSHAEWGAW